MEPTREAATPSSTKRTLPPKRVNTSRYVLVGGALGVLIGLSLAMCAAHGEQRFWFRVLFYYCQLELAGLPIGLAIGYSVAKRVEAARFRRWDRLVAPKCVVCEYDLRGNTSNICPECGTPIERDPAADQSPRK